MQWLRNISEKAFSSSKKYRNVVEIFEWKLYCHYKLDEIPYISDSLPSFQFWWSALKCSLKLTGRESYIVKDKSKECAHCDEIARCFQTTNKATLSLDMV